MNPSSMLTYVSPGHTEKSEGDPGLGEGCNQQLPQLCAWGSRRRQELAGVTGSVDFFLSFFSPFLSTAHFMCRHVSVEIFSKTPT